MVPSVGPFLHYRFQISHSRMSSVQLAGESELPKPIAGWALHSAHSPRGFCFSYPRTLFFLQYQGPGGMWGMEWYSSVGRKQWSERSWFCNHRTSSGSPILFLIRTELIFRNNRRKLPVMQQRTNCCKFHQEPKFLLPQPSQALTPTPTQGLKGLEHDQNLNARTISGVIVQEDLVLTP